MTYDVHHGAGGEEGQKRGGWRRGQGWGCGAWRNMRRRAQGEEGEKPAEKEMETDGAATTNEADNVKPTTTNTQTPDDVTMTNTDKVSYLKINIIILNILLRKKKLL